MSKLNLQLIWLPSAIIILTSSISSADDLAAHENNPVSNKTTFRNPFESQLPKKETVEEDQTQPEDMPGTSNVSQPIPDTFNMGQQIEKLQNSKKEDFDSSKFIIAGLVWDTDRPQTIINGQVLSVGDTVNEAKIISIQKTGVNVIINDTVYSIKP